MLEWYRAGEGYDGRIDRRRRAPGAGGGDSRSVNAYFGSLSVDPFAEPERLSVADAFLRHAGIDLLATVTDDGETDRDALAAQMRLSGLRVAEDDRWADLYSRVLVERIEPHLGIGRATILDRYPVSEAALARPAGDDARWRSASSFMPVASSLPMPSAS